MLVDNPVQGTIKPDARFYPEHPLAVFRAPGNHDPLVTHDFGPTPVEVEPRVDWPGGESNIFGRSIPAKTYPNFHLGIDISKGGCGSDVLAAAKGTVTMSRLNASGAGVIVVDHEMVGSHHYQTGYVHLSQRLVKVGADVEAGDVIGELGDTGISTGCHLHFYIAKDGDRVDPWRRLRQNTAIDPDKAIVNPPAEVPDVPIPASDADYLAGQVAVIGNSELGAHVRDGAKITATKVRTVPAGKQESWLPTCWVEGETALGSDRWLTRWHDGQWEFTHQANVRSVTAL